MAFGTTVSEIWAPSNGSTKSAWAWHSTLKGHMILDGEYSHVTIHKVMWLVSKQQNCDIIITNYYTSWSIKLVYSSHCVQAAHERKMEGRAKEEGLADIATFFTSVYSRIWIWGENRKFGGEVKLFLLVLYSTFNVYVHPVGVEYLYYKLFVCLL